MFGVDGGILASVGVFFICVVIFPGNLIFLGFLGVTKPTEVLDGFSSADDMQGLDNSMDDLLTTLDYVVDILGDYE